jgi:hypothetical protein
MRGFYGTTRYANLTGCPLLQLWSYESVYVRRRLGEGEGAADRPTMGTLCANVL